METFFVETDVPGTDDETFTTYADAVAYAKAIIDAWDDEHPESIADRGWASRDNYYAAKCGRYAVAVVQGEDI